MKKYIKIAVGALIVLFIGILILPYFFNVNNIKVQINQASNKFLESELLDDFTKKDVYFQINGSIKLQTLPSAKIIVNNMEAKNLRLKKSFVNFTVPKIEFKVSLFQLILGKISVTNISFIDAEYYLNRTYDSISSEKNAEITKEDLSSLDINNGQIVDLYNFIKSEVFNGKNISLTDIGINLQNNEFYLNAFSNKLKLLKSDFDLGLSDGLSVNGEAELNGKMINIESVSKNNFRKKEFKGNVNVFSPIVKWVFKYSGSYESPLELENLTINSESNLDIKNIQLFTKWLFDKDSWQHKKLISEEDFNIEFLFKYNKGDFSFNDVQINSVNLNGKGNFIFDSRNVSGSSLKFSFSEINLDNLITKGFASSKQFSLEEVQNYINQKNISKADIKNDKILYNSFFEYFPFRKSDFQIDLGIAKILYNKKEINNLKFTANTMTNGFLKVDYFGFDLPQNGKFVLKGSADYKNSNSGFVSEFSLYGDNFREVLDIIGTRVSHVEKEFLKTYSSSGNIIISNGIFSIKNLQFAIDDFNVVGNGNILFSNGINYIIFNADIDKLDIEKYVHKNPKSILVNGSLKEQLLYINSFNINTLLKLNIGNLIYKNYVEKDYTMKINYGQGFLRVYDLDLKSKNFALRGGFDFDIREEQPIMNTDLKFERLELFNSKGLVENTLESKSIDETKEDANDEVVDRNIRDTLDLIFALPSLSGMEGIVKMSMDNAKIEGVEINNFKLLSELDNGRLNFDELVIGVFDGKFNVKGSFNLGNLVDANLLFDGCTLNSANLLDFLANKKNIDGIFIFNGILKTSGIDRKEFLDNMVVKFNTKGIGIEISDFGLNDLMLSMFSIYKDEAKLANFNARDILYDKDRSTLIRDVSGIFQIKDRKSSFKFDIESVAINGAYSGFIVKNKLDSVSTFVFLTGTKTKQIPVGLTIKVIGDLKNLNLDTNFSQVDEYVNSLRNIMTN